MQRRVSLPKPTLGRSIKIQTHLHALRKNHEYIRSQLLFDIRKLLPATSFRLSQSRLS